MTLRSGGEEYSASVSPARSNEEVVGPGRRVGEAADEDGDDDEGEAVEIDDADLVGGLRRWRSQRTRRSQWNLYIIM